MAQICSQSFAGIEGSNPTEGMDGHLLCLLCVWQVTACAMSRSLVQRSPAGCASLVLSDLETSAMRWTRPNLACCATGKKYFLVCFPIFWSSYYTTELLASGSKQFDHQRFFSFFFSFLFSFFFFFFFICLYYSECLACISFALSSGSS